MVPANVGRVSDDAVLVQADGLVKRFGDFEAVRGIDVKVRRGEAFGFLGPNGAGKSSTMRMIACTSPRSAGELRVLGLDPDRQGPRIRARLGVVPQQDNLDNELTVRQNLQVYGRYFGLSRAQVRAREQYMVPCAFVQRVRFTQTSRWRRSRRWSQIIVNTDVSCKMKISLFSDNTLSLKSTFYTKPNTSQLS